MIENVIPVPRAVCPACHALFKIHVRGPVRCENCSKELIVADIRADYFFVEFSHYEGFKQRLQALEREAEGLRSENGALRERSLRRLSDGKA
ncbi:hypothetical protein HRbin02_01738 [Candidatus Calditenuaceae archaeon HR02]|nr:hypothetical protein HRbin02_01738 [Candidatus Calditenuaceae archaeon HR02]